MKACMSRKRQGVYFCNSITKRCKLNQWSYICWVIIYQKKNALLASSLATLWSSRWLFVALSHRKDVANATLLKMIVHMVQDDTETLSRGSQRTSQLARMPWNMHLTHKEKPLLIIFHHHHSCFMNPVHQLRNQLGSTSGCVQFSCKNFKAEVFSHEIIYRDFKLLPKHIRGLEGSTLPLFHFWTWVGDGTNWPRRHFISIPHGEIILHGKTDL